MGDASHQPERLEGQHSDHATAKVRADHVDHCNHQNAHDRVGLEGGEGHLLTQRLQLSLHRGDLLLVSLALRLDHVGVL